MNSLFGKWVTATIAVLLIGFLALSLALNAVLENYFINRQAQELISQSHNFQGVFDDAYDGETLSIDSLSTEMKNLEQYVGATVWLVNRSGGVFVSPRLKDYSKVTGELDSKEIDQVFSGQTVIRKGTIKTVSKNPVLTVGYPIRHNGTVVLALFTHVSMPGIQRVSQDVSKIGFMALIFTVLLALAVIFALTRAMTRDIKDLNRAARYIREGNMDYQIETHRKDELGELASSFNEMAAQLARTEDMRRKFISDLSHDLRSPLTSIMGYAQGLLDGTVSEEKRVRSQQIILEESQRLLKLANDILDLSKMQSGELQIEPQMFDMHQMLLQTLETFDTRIQQKEAEVQFQLEPNGRKVWGDPEHIARVVVNLMDNAVKFVNPGGVIEVKTEAKGGKLLVGIRNTGTVIPEAEQPLVWHRFSKRDLSRGTEKSSSGLGLAIVREILKAHEEKIELYSNDHIGVLFIFSLPLKNGA